MNEKTNIKIDIINTVTEVKVVLIIFGKVPKCFPPIKLKQENAIQTLTRGSIITTKKPSTMEIKRRIEALPTVALEILPLIMYIAVIIGEKAPITPVKVFKYDETISHIDIHILKTVMEMHKVEQIWNVFLTAPLEKLVLRVAKIDEINISTRIEAKNFKTLSIPENK